LHKYHDYLFTSLLNAKFSLLIILCFYCGWHLIGHVSAAGADPEALLRGVMGQGPKGRSWRPEGPKRGVGFLGKGSQPQSGRASAVSSPSGVWGKAPGTIDLMWFKAQNLCLVTIFVSRLWVGGVIALLPMDAPLMCCCLCH